MPTLRLKTNLRCGACVAKIQPAFDSASEITRWSADLTNPDKILTVEGPNLTRNVVENLLQPLDYKVLGEVNEPIPAAENPDLAATKPATYFPLLLILAYLLGATALLEIALSPSPADYSVMRCMRHFMAGFFLVFSFFKLLNLQAFADAYESYDIIAAKWHPWGLIYPWIELALGAAYLANFQPILTNAVTLVVMGISTLGVVQTVLAKRQIRCACLGTVFNLPMSSVTIIEDLLMVAMSLVMLSMFTY